MDNEPERRVEAGPLAAGAPVDAPLRLVPELLGERRVERGVKGVGIARVVEGLGAESRRPFRGLRRLAELDRHPAEAPHLAVAAALEQAATSLIVAEGRVLDLFKAAPARLPFRELG